MRAHITVSGIVQGVFYREFTRRQASALGLAGWVRNLPDGKVEAIVEGDKDDVEELVARMRQGPPSARIDEVSLAWVTPEGKLCGFDIRY
jgi:acylphosphatase